jgi:hypothetical protein
MNSYETQFLVFTTVNFILSCLVVASFLGVTPISPKYTETILTIMQIYVSLFLVVRFNPFVKKPNFSPLDREVVYYAGLVMLANTTFAKYVKDQLNI